MKKGIKKAIACTLLVGMAQFGLATTVTIEASPRTNGWHQQQQQFNNGRHERQENERQYRQNLENQRHEREMQRRENEEWQAWNDRQYLENQSHNQIITQIGQDVLQLFLD